MKTEYHSKPWPIRVYRWCRFMPLATLEAGVMLLAWALNGCPYQHPHMLKSRLGWSRRHEAKMIWRTSTSIARFNMGDTLPFEDYIRDLRKGR